MADLPNEAVGGVEDDSPSQGITNLLGIKRRHQRPVGRRIEDDRSVVSSVQVRHGDVEAIGRWCHKVMHGDRIAGVHQQRISRASAVFEHRVEGRGFIEDARLTGGNDFPNGRTDRVSIERVAD